ncbi:MAG: hypothetical protein NTW29_19245 [Bacteroidetes bacterium]|nr:hypothetical protein [Bacteroidota bacterium]
MQRPYSNPALNTIYHQLFCDEWALYKTDPATPAEFPWSVLLSDTEDQDALTSLANDSSNPSRVRLLAARRLAAAGKPISGNELLGVIIEVGMDTGLDTLAAFKDGSARYINHAEKIIIWDSGTRESNAIIEDLIQVSKSVVAQIGPWTDARLPAPGPGTLRLNFLVTDGLYFGEGPFNVLQQDAMGGPVIQAALALLQYLTSVNENRDAEN